MRVPFFYGWVVALGGAVSASFVLGSNQFALSTFLVPMEEELGWPRSVFFGALSVRYLLAGMLGPIVGPWADGVHAPRLILPVGVVLLSGSLAAVKWIDDPTSFLLLYGVVGAVGAALLHLQFWEAIVLKWFVRKRARALVVSNIGEASGPMIFPIAITLLVALVGWRDAWFIYGTITLLVLMPFTLLVRTRPEQLGQTIDGMTLHDDSTSEQRPLPNSMQRSDAVRTKSFWLLAGAFTVTGLSITGFQSQWIPHFRDVGFDATAAASAVAVYGVSNIVSRVIWGLLAERFPVRILLASHAIAAGIGVVALLTLVNNPAALFAWASYQGLVLGSFFQLHTLIMAEYFGRMHIGAVRGLMQPPSSLSRAAGAVTFAAIRDWRGNYTVAFAIVAGLWAGIFFLVAIARQPKPR